MVQIIPAILATREEEYAQDINRLNEVPTLEQGWIHIDFMDNKFVPNQSIEPSVINKYPTEFKKEAHLMVNDLDKWINEVAEAGFNRILIHFEASEEQKVKEGLMAIKNKGIEAGMVVNPGTDIGKTKNLFSILDVILIMGVVPGFQGRPFEKDTFDKVKETFRLRKESNSDFKIAVDGGVRDENARQLVESGVDYLIVGSFLLKGDIDENLEKIWQALQS